MNINTIISTFILIPVLCLAENRISFEIFEYGLYSGSDGNSVYDSLAPTQQKLMGGDVCLLEQTNVIKASLGDKFGISFVVKGNDGESVPLTFIYRFPEMEDPKTHRKIMEYRTNVRTKQSVDISRMLWDFTEEWELVPGVWIFEVYYKDKIALQKEFVVEEKGSEKGSPIRGSGQTQNTPPFR
jgi:hypothetical protein